MTDTQPVIVEAVPVSQIDKQDLYSKAYALLVAARRAVTAAAASGDMYRHIDLLADRTEALGALMFPPPPPAAPEGATPMYAHAVPEKAQVWLKSHGWAKVLETGRGNMGVRWMLEVPGTSVGTWREFDVDDIFAVRLPAAVAE